MKEREAADLVTAQSWVPELGSGGGRVTSSRSSSDIQHETNLANPEQENLVWRVGGRRRGQQKHTGNSPKCTNPQAQGAPQSPRNTNTNGPCVTVDPEKAEPEGGKKPVMTYKKVTLG